MDIARSVRTCLVLASVLAATAPAFPAGAADDCKPRSITVVGVGRERGAPDTAQLQFAVEHTAPNATAASQAAATSAAQVMAALRKQAGSDGRVETAGFQLNPVYRRDDRTPVHERRSEIVGYTAVNDITVRTPRVDGVGALIDAAIAAGAARITGLSFTIDDPAPAQARALKGAGADAAAQAQTIAEALHVKLKGILEAAAEGGARPIPQRYAAMAMRAEAETPIEPGEVVTEARLRVTYGIE